MSRPEKVVAGRRGFPSVSAIIITWNSADDIRGCLESLRDEWPDAEIIVVDNASRDDTVDVVKRECGDVSLIENERNLEYAKANNQGIERSNGEYLRGTGRFQCVQTHQVGGGLQHGPCQHGNVPSYARDPEF